MKVKVYCPCGSKFEFEIEPVDGRMPVRLNCPTCGQDATELANTVIQSQLAPPVTASTGLKIHSSAPATVAATAAPPEPEIPATAPPCPRHKSETAIETCRVCGKPICVKCMEQFGYVCSVFCRQKADASGMDVPVYARQKSLVVARSSAMAKYIMLASVVSAVLLMGFYVWYTYFAREPKIIYTRKLPVRDRLSLRNTPTTNFYFQLLGPGQLLTIENQQVSVLDCPANKILWSATLPDKASERSVSFFFNDEDSLASRVVTTSNDVWVISPGNLSRFDRLTGAPKEVVIQEPILNIIPGEDAFLVVSGNPGHELLNRIALPDGTVQSEDLNAKSPAKIAPAVPTASGRPEIAQGKGGKSGKGKKPAPVPDAKPLTQSAKILALASKNGDADLAESQTLFDEIHAPFISAGPNVVQFKTTLIEEKTATHAAMKAKPKGPSKLDNANLTASQGMEVAQEMLSDSRRESTGGVETEDVSTYQVTLHRRFAPDVPDWTGEVTGPPQFFALKTVDVVAAGQTLYVFNKQNKKLWEARLTFAAPLRFLTEHAPALETDDALYFADVGMLTRFDLKTGEVKWRYNSVGISKVSPDARGMLYLDTTTAGPESIQYTQEINLNDKVHSLLVKLDPSNGKALWKKESAADKVMLSGKFLYGTRVSRVAVLLRLEDGPDTHYYEELIDPSNGSPIWTFHRTNKHIMNTEAQGKWVLIHFEDQVYVLNFFSL